MTDYWTELGAYLDLNPDFIAKVERVDGKDEWRVTCIDDTIRWVNGRAYHEWHKPDE